MSFIPFEFPIFITVDDTPVEGVARVTSFGTLRVEITNPYQGLESGKRLSFFSRLPNSQYFGDNDITREYADKILESVFLCARHALKHLGVAETAFEVMAQHRQEINKPTERPRLKRLFKSGELKQHEYQLLINKLNDARLNFRNRLDEVEHALFVDIFGDHLWRSDLSGWKQFLQKHIAHR